MQEYNGKEGQENSNKLLIFQILSEKIFGKIWQYKILFLYLQNKPQRDKNKLIPTALFIMNFYNKIDKN